MLSLIRGVHERARWVIWSLIVVTTITSGSQGVFWGTQAKPLKKIWEPATPGKLASKKLLVVSIITFTGMELPFPILVATKAIALLIGVL